MNSNHCLMKIYYIASGKVSGGRRPPETFSIYSIWIGFLNSSIATKVKSPTMAFSLS